MWGERCGLADRREWEGDPSDTCVGRTRLKVEDPGMPGAHRNHSFHRRDHGRVEAQRLIERPRALSRQNRRAYTMRGERWGLADRRAWGGGPSGTRTGGRGPA